MAKVKNRRDNHLTKRPHSSSEYESYRDGQFRRFEGDEYVKAEAGQKDRASKGTKKTPKNEGAASKPSKKQGKTDSRYGKQEKTVSGAKRQPKADSRHTAQKPERKAVRSLIGNAAMPDDTRRETENSNIIVGRNPVTEALKAGREIDKILVTSREGSVIKILGMAKDAGIPVMYVEKAALDRISDGKAHQGVAAYISPYAYGSMEDIMKRAEESGEPPFIFILDGIEDPHNLGAIMRTAECAGAHGIIIPKRHASGLTDVVAKSSAGAIEYMPVVKATNIAQTIDELKELGIWTAACDMGGPEYYNQDMSGGIAIVIGSEGFGISKLVKEKCDFIVSMPMVGKITSLNASNAAAVVAYEVRRQRNKLAAVY